MKLQPPDPTIVNPDAALQAKHNSLAHPEVRNEIGTQPHTPLVVQFILAECGIHGTKPLHAYRLLDVGCGDGELLRQLGRTLFASDQLCGLDIEPAHVKLARYRTDEKIRIDVSDFSVQVPEHQFDFITAIGWVWCDWRNRHAYAVARTAAPEPTMLDKVAENVGRSLLLGGYFIHDWRRRAEQYDLDAFRAALERGGVILVHTMIEPLQGRGPSTSWATELASDSSLYIYRKERE